MDKETIYQVVEKFNDIYFKNIHNIIEKNFNFVDKLGLVAPKKNYLFTYKYLCYVYNNFIRIDNEFASQTLNKLKRDIDNLQEFLEMYEDAHEAQEEIFQESFLKKSQLFTYMNLEITKLKEHNVANNKQEIQELQQHIDELHQIYLESFENDFTEQNRYVLKDLKEILNTKTYYFDRLLWMDAHMSHSIDAKLKKINMKKGLESKSYLLVLLEVALPYSENYKYFEKCLKVYK